MRALTCFTTQHQASWALQRSVKRLELWGFFQGFTFCNLTIQVVHKDDFIFQYTQVRDQLSPRLIKVSCTMSQLFVANS